mgnify:CR=1 FL=1
MQASAQEQNASPSIETRASLTANEAKATKKGFGVFINHLLQRMNLMSRAGLTFGGDRDLYAVFGYNRMLRVEDLYAKYVRQDVARTIVEAPADALWTRPPVLQADEAFMSAWAELTGRIDVWNTLNRADYTLGFSRFCCLIVGLDDGRPLDQPATPGARCVYLQPYSELGVQISDYDNDTRSPRFGLPMYYQISINETEQGQAGRTLAVPRVAFKAHWTRVVHLSDLVVEDPVFGRPRLESVYNLLDDLLKVVGGSAETYWLTSNRGMQINVDKDMKLSETDAAALSDEIEEYVHNLRRTIRTRGVEIMELGARVAPSKDPVDTIVSLLSATTRIPKRLLLGSEAGQLASEQDRANWAERVDERRIKFGQSRVIIPFVSRLAEIGALPRPEGLKIEWPSAFILAPLEAGQTAAQRARSAANLSKVILDHGERLITVKEARTIIGFTDESAILDDNPVTDAPIS